MAKKEQNVLHIDDTEQRDDEDEITLSTAKCEVVSQAGDEAVEFLHKQMSRGKLLLQPSFQRLYVWDRQTATRLIESALMGIPLPVVYLAEEDDGKRSIIDGQQRLTSFFSFIDGTFPNGQLFRLGKMQFFPKCNDLLFKEMPEELQDRISECLIRTITFKKGSDASLKYNVFERLNTGSSSLTDQELRNCIFRGPYNDLLRELSQDKDFRDVVGLTSEEKRMRDVELVLRYCAFLNKGYTNYRAPIKRFLNEEAAERRNISKEKAAEIRRCFKNSVQLVKSLLGKNVFHRYLSGNEECHNGKWEERVFNVALYDILMVCFAREDKNKVMRNLDAIRESWIDMQTNDIEFMEFLRVATSTPKSVTFRFDVWRKRLALILDGDERQKRCFSREIKERLFKKDPTCALCHQRIQTIDDAAVDHIEQYWTGGKTIPENARLAHRYCNCARPRNG